MDQTISQESYSDCTREKKKLRIVKYLNYSNCVSFSSWDQVQIVSNWEQSMLYTKSLQVLHRKGISMLTGLKVSSLTCKFVFSMGSRKGGTRWNSISQALK